MIKYGYIAFLTFLIVLAGLSCDRERTKINSTLSAIHKDSALYLPKHTVRPTSKESKEDPLTTYLFEDKRIENYLEGHEIKPDYTIDNVRDIDIRVEDPNEKISLSNHTINWNYTETEGVKIAIDGHHLKSWDSDQNPANNWDQIKYYNCNGREIISISMSIYMCNGSGCGYNAYLFYDIQNKTSTFVDAFRSNLEMNLYRFASEDISYINVDYSEEGHDSDNHDVFINSKYTLYTLDKTGYFEQQLDSNKKEYYISIEYHRDGTNVKQHWVEKIDL